MGTSRNWLIPCLHKTQLTFLLYRVTFSIVKWYLPYVNVSRVNTVLVLPWQCWQCVSRWDHRQLTFSGFIRETVCEVSLDHKTRILTKTMKLQHTDLVFLCFSLHWVGLWAILARFDPLRSFLVAFLFSSKSYFHDRMKFTIHLSYILSLGCLWWDLCKMTV